MIATRLLTIALLTSSFVSVARSGVSAEDPAEQLLRTLKTADDDRRVEAIGALGRLYSEAALDRAISSLATPLKDPNPRVRAAAAKTMGSMVSVFKRPCPIELVEAIEDPDEDVRQTVVSNLIVEEYPEGALAIFERGMKSSDTMVRNNMPFYVATAGGNTPRAIAILAAGAKDESRLTRHNSEVYLWKFVKDRGRIVRYGLATIDERRDAPEAALPEEEARQEAATNLLAEAMPDFLGGLAAEDPAAFALIFVEEAKNPRVEVRRGVAAFFAHLPRLPRPVAEALVEAGVEEALAGLAADADESLATKAKEAERALKLFRETGSPP